MHFSPFLSSKKSPKTRNNCYKIVLLKLFFYKLLLHKKLQKNPPSFSKQNGYLSPFCHTLCVTIQKKCKFSKNSVSLFTFFQFYNILNLSIYLRLTEMMKRAKISSIYLSIYLSVIFHFLKVNTYFNFFRHSAA